MSILLLVLLGLATYFIVQRSVASITKTPAWILWLVMMASPLVWLGWTLVYGQNKPMPVALTMGVFLISVILYCWLILLGRKDLTPPATQNSDIPTPEQTANPDGQVLKVRPINKEEETQLRECFPWTVYYLQNLEYRPQAVICKGQLRTKPDVAYKTIRENIEAKFGDRFLIVFQEGFNTTPFFALVPNPQAQSNTQRNSEPLTRPGLALVLLATTFYTTTIVGAQIAGVTRQAVESNSAVLLKGLPYALALIAIMGIHEIGHYLASRFYKLRTTLPYFIPVPFFPGTFGAFIQMRSLAPDRKVLFDVGIAGPLAGFIVTLPLLIWGLANSTIVPISEKAGILNMNAFIPSSSLLLTFLSKLALGNALTPDKAIDLHPVAVAGYLGLIVTAFNLMPVGQLDGGHIVHAMFGQKQATAIGQISRFLLLTASLMPWLLGVTIIPPYFLYWAVFLYIIPIYDEPALNDVSELDNKRDLWGLLALGLLLIIILPAPRFLIQLLKI
ncbi:site-2 protease family protein [Aerosakkonema sp. BLCC-F183]|uniref:site-2 protease family protein n=1 Tax=Aerosakkonema sp. BLCC-F183 TaxID=3342834 RepID=UPI0035B7E166